MCLECVGSCYYKEFDSAFDNVTSESCVESDDGVGFSYVELLCMRYLRYGYPDASLTFSLPENMGIFTYVYKKNCGDVLFIAISN